MMRVLTTLGTAVLLLALAGSATAQRSSSHATYAVLRVGTQPLATTTARIPSAPTAIVNVAFNGHSEQASWSSSQTEIEYGWHGVIVTLSGTRKAGPVVMRAASTRADVVRVVVRISWH